MSGLDITDTPEGGRDPITEEVKGVLNSSEQ